MKSSIRRRVSLLLWLLPVCLSAATVPPEAMELEYVHKGLQYYCSPTNELIQATQVVSNGLKLYPNSPQLKKLWELLNKQSQQNASTKDQDNKNGEQQKEQKQDEKQSEDQKKEQQQPKPEEQKDQQQQQSQEKKDEKPGEEKPGQQPQPQDKQEGDPQDPQGAPQTAPMRMKPEDAIRLLEALKADEKAMPFQPILRTNRQQRVFKDW